MAWRERGINMRAHFTGLTLSAASAVLGLLCSVAPVAAQSGGGGTQASGGIEEVTVTATRREEKLSKVP